MNFSRREFVKTAGVAFGAAAVLPSWVYDAHAAGEALFNVNKDALADAALACAGAMRVPCPSRLTVSASAHEIVPQ